MNDQPTIEVLTRIIGFLAERLIDTNARVMATETMLKACLRFGDADPKDFASQMEKASALHRPSAADTFLQKLKEDQEFAWLAAQVQSGTVH